MTSINDINYCIGLRAKTGEWQALQMLSAEVACRVLPRLIVPPAKERDDRQMAMFADRGFLSVAADLKQYWTHRTALIDPTFVIDEFGRETPDKWFASTIETSARAGGPIVPCVRWMDLKTAFGSNFTACTNASTGKLAVVLSLAEATDAEEIQQLVDWIAARKLLYSDCVVIADFAGADFSDPTSVAPVLAEAFQVISDGAPWCRIVFQGSNFPDQNPAAEGGQTFVPRNEWLAWREALPAITAFGVPGLYGDYGADSSKIEFKKARAKAWPHLRYATSTDWLVRRGAANESFATAMQNVAKAIVGSGSFDGSGFSEADRQIAMIASGMSGCGTPKMWRAINMAHHITKVVNDLATLEGKYIEQREDVVFPEQVELFDQ